MFEVVVVGAGAAGLSAALVLGRARRGTLVLDSGEPRNAPADRAHGVFTRDGTPPADVLRIGREQLRPYASVAIQSGMAVDARAVGNRFEVSLADGGVLRTRKVLLAFGVIDELPEITGMRQFWGSSVFHCPYCHGWEVRDEPLAVYGRGESGVELALLLLGWSRDLVLCTDGPGELTGDQRAQLARHGIGIREEPIARLEGSADGLDRVVFADGSTMPRRALFLHPHQHLRSDLAVRLGCEVMDTGLIRTDEWGETTTAGVYAAGDAVMPIQQLIRAAASAASAAMAINHALVKEDFG